MEEEMRIGNRDRGWNDPPAFSYNKGAQAQNSPRRNVLNQRVGMPLNFMSPPPAGQVGTDGQPSPPISSSTPPPKGQAPPQGPPPSIGPPPPGSKDTPRVGGVDATPQEEETVSCESTLAKFKDVLEQCRNSLQKRVVTDIERRLKMLQDSWDKSKLSPPVQQRTSKLATELQARRYDAAHEIHLSLMIDHVSEVSQWMVGVKRLIHECRTCLPPQEEVEGKDKESVEDSPGPWKEKEESPGSTSCTENTESAGLKTEDQELPTDSKRAESNICTAPGGDGELQTESDIQEESRTNLKVDENVISKGVEDVDINQS